MKIVVCVKHVPESAEVTVDVTTGRPNWSSTTGTINAFDTYALEQGVLLKEKHGGEVIVLTVGHAKAVEVLRDAISCGADSGILLEDDAFNQSDSLATGAVLAKAVEKIGGVDIVLCGKQTMDGSTAQVPAALAASLGWPQAAYVSAVPASSETSITVHRMLEEGYDVCELDLPAVISAVKDLNSPRIPSLRSKMAAKKAEIPVWSAADLGVDPSAVGRDGSPTKVMDVRRPLSRDRATLTLSGDPAEIAEKLAHELKAYINR